MPGTGAPDGMGDAQAACKGQAARHVWEGVRDRVGRAPARPLTHRPLSLLQTQRPGRAAATEEDCECLLGGQGASLQPAILLACFEERGKSQADCIFEPLTKRITTLHPPQPPPMMLTD